MAAPAQAHDTPAASPPKPSIEELKARAVEAAKNGVDADMTSIDVLVETLLADKPAAFEASESHVMWLRRETLKLIRREASLAMREQAMTVKEELTRRGKGRGCRK